MKRNISIIAFNAVSNGFCLGAYFLYINENVDLRVMLIDCICILLSGGIIAACASKYREPIKLLCCYIFSICIIALYALPYKIQPGGSHLPLGVIWIVFSIISFVVIYRSKEYTVANALQKIALLSYGLYILLGIVVLCVLGDGCDCADGGGCCDLPGNQKKKRRAPPSD